LLCAYVKSDINITKVNKYENHNHNQSQKEICIAPLTIPDCMAEQQ